MSLILGSLRQQGMGSLNSLRRNFSRLPLKFTVFQWFFMFQYLGQHPVQSYSLKAQVHIISMTQPLCLSVIVWFQKISIPPTEGFFQFYPTTHWILHPRGLHITSPTPWNFFTWSLIPLGNNFQIQKMRIYLFILINLEF